ncbi:MAG: hypothetical protein WB807_04400 [Candidatus Dormiibacterota bacterium]
MNPLEWAHGLILPWITLAFISSATYVRLSAFIVVANIVVDGLYGVIDPRVSPS